MVYDESLWHIIVAGKLYAPEEITGPVAVVFQGKTIREIWRNTDDGAAQRRFAEYMPDTSVEVSDIGLWSLAPGYIDLHIHGFHGYDVTTGSQEDIEAMARELPQTGVTSFFPTIATLDREETMQQVQRIADVADEMRDVPVAEILGMRLEGPFISRAKKGAQYEQGIRPPDSAELERLAVAGRGCIRLLNFAPEEDEDGSFLATLVRLGILPCIGHTAATYEQTITAIDGGARHSTHLFNAMSSLEQRSPGVVGALLTDSRVTVEMIADGIHLHPAVTKLAIAARGTHDIALITDAISPAGLPEGMYDFVGRKVTVCCGAVHMSNGTLAGSILTLDQAVRNIVEFTGISWAEAISMASQVPARIAGCSQRKGCIAPGMDADVIALDEHGVVQRTWIHGSLVYDGASL